PLQRSALGCIRVIVFFFRRFLLLRLVDSRMLGYRAFGRVGQGGVRGGLGRLGRLGLGQLLDHFLGLGHGFGYRLGGCGCSWRTGLLRRGLGWGFSLRFGFSFGLLGQTLGLQATLADFARVVKGATTLG